MCNDIRLGLIIAGLVASLTGCTHPVRVQTTQPDPVWAQAHQSRAVSHVFSPNSQYALRALEIHPGAKLDLRASIERLDLEIEADPDGPWLLAASELLLEEAERRAEGPAADASLFLAAALYADRQLARSLKAADGSMLTREVLLASDLNHRALAGFVALTSDGWAGESGSDRYDVEGAGGHFRIDTPKPNRPGQWSAHWFDRLLPTSMLQVEGFSEVHRAPALGVSLVGVRWMPQARLAETPNLPPEGLHLPVTLIARFKPLDHDTKLTRVELTLWDTDRVTSVERYGQVLRLSTDTTSPIASLFAATRLHEEGHEGLFDTDTGQARIGVYMHEPYDPKKIPVLMVHGLWSSPLTWREALNGLRAEPEFVRRYQFWMFLYPSGMPLPRSAAFLRQSLSELKDHYDPMRIHPGPRRMVVFGHSMGGLLAKTLVQDSGDYLWDSFHPEPFQTVQAPDEVKARLSEAFCYTHDPDVARVVFIATPHRGSDLADSWMGRFGRERIVLPELLEGVDLWIEQERERLAMTGTLAKRYQIADGLPTSIHNLSPDAPYLSAYNATPIRPGVPLHSIIGNQDSDEPGGSDGVVPYASAHWKGAVSEVVVRSDHDAHTHPRAVHELRRILREHLRAVDSEVAD